MAITISSDKKKEVIPWKIEKILPSRLAEEIKRRSCGRTIEEIRLRRERAASITVGGENIMLGTVLSGAEIDTVLAEMCGHSLYAHSETIRRGYIALEGGIRVGVCGRASLEGGRIYGVYDVSSLNIRIPHTLYGVGEPICRLLRRKQSGILVYSPPCGGKTTLLRSVAMKMASGEKPLRVALIDTRGELAPTASGKGLCLDILSGYPREAGIEIATRTMGAELIICDEIGDVSEAEAMIAAENCGVSFLASAHSDSLFSLLQRSGIRRLHDAHVFSTYVRIERLPSDFRYEFSSREEADDILQGRGERDAHPLQQSACSL